MRSYTKGSCTTFTIPEDITDITKQMMKVYLPKNRKLDVYIQAPGNQLIFANCTMSLLKLQFSFEHLSQAAVKSVTTFISECLRMNRSYTICDWNAVCISTDFIGKSKANKANLGDERRSHLKKVYFWGLFKVSIQITLLFLLSLCLKLAPQLAGNSLHLQPFLRQLCDDK